METHLALSIGKTLIVTNVKPLPLKVGDKFKLEFPENDPNTEYFSNLELEIIGIWEEVSGIKSIKGPEDHRVYLKEFIKSIKGPEVHINLKKCEL